MPSLETVHKILALLKDLPQLLIWVGLCMLAWVCFRGVREILASDAIKNISEGVREHGINVNLKHSIDTESQEFIASLFSTEKKSHNNQTSHRANKSAP